MALASSKRFDAGVDTEIDGGGLITLDAGNQRRHFDIRDVGTTLTLRGLTLRSGQASDFGGAVNVGAGDGLFVHDGRFFNNGAAFGGGAIAGQPGSSLIVLDSRFDLNSAGSGGAIAKTGQLTIANSQFAENTAADQGGPVPGWFPIGGNIVASTFSGNGAARRKQRRRQRAAPRVRSPIAAACSTPATRTPILHLPRRWRLAGCGRRATLRADEHHFA